MARQPGRLVHHKGRPTGRLVHQAPPPPPKSQGKGRKPGKKK